MGLKQECLAHTQALDELEPVSAQRDGKSARSCLDREDFCSKHLGSNDGKKIIVAGFLQRLSSWLWLHAEIAC
jgi:hypothetical protein